MKKTKSKKPKAEHESHVVEKENKASFKPKKMGSEIDEIFTAKKRKRLENEKKGEDEKAGKVVAANMRPLDKKKRKSSKTRSFEQNSFADRISQQKKKTADGLTIFTEEELGIGKPDAGGTSISGSALRLHLGRDGCSCYCLCAYCRERRFCYYTAHPQRNPSFVQG